jgi:hypothetical protein
MNALSRQEDIATAIQLTNNKCTAFIEILFIDHLFQTIQQTERQLEQEKQQARDRISQLLSRKTSDQLYAWIINTNLDIPSRLPIGSPHTPPKTCTPTLDTHSSQSAVPKPVCIRQHTKSEINQINHRRKVLLQNFPEDQPMESFANPILIEDDGDKDVVLLQRSEEARRELVLRFAMYHRYNTHFTLHFTPCFISVSHVVSPPSYIHMTISSNDIFTHIYLAFYSSSSNLFHLSLIED